MVNQKISILTPTIREDGVQIVKKSLSRQTSKDFEWLVGSYFNPKIGKSGRWIKDDFKGGYWSLNRIYNKLIKEAKGDLIVSWQDFTYADPEAIEKFAFHHKNEPKTIVTGVGNKYSNQSWAVKTWQDPRERTDQGSFYGCYFNDIEGNFCSCPKEVLLKIGGFDEKLDFLGFGMDWYGVFERIKDFGGYDFKIDQSNKSYSLGHPRVGGEKRWEHNNLIHGGYIKRKKELIKKDVWPNLDYIG